MDAPDLVAAIRQADERHRLFLPGERVVVGVSGGPDSVALLHALSAYAPERELELVVAHLDHTLRPDSAEEAALVARLARELGLPAHLAARDVAGLAASSGFSLEEASRHARYGYLAAVAARVGAGCVAVGHQADDQAETVLMHFLRGSGLAGLAGMRPVAEYPLSAAEIAAVEPEVPVAAPADRLTQDPPPDGQALEGPENQASRMGSQDVGHVPSPPWPPRLVRPLLAVDRRSTQAYVEAVGLESCQDPSNQDPSFLRNRLRHHLLPLLETVNPRLKEALIRNAAAIAADQDYLEQLTDQVWQRCVLSGEEGYHFDLAVWQETPLALQRRLIRRAARRLGLGRQFGWEHVEQVCRAVAEGGTPPGLPGGVQLRRQADGFALVPPSSPLPPPRLTAEPVPLPVPGELHLPGGWQVRCQLRQRRRVGDRPPANPWQAWLDADVAGTSLIVRGRRPGDRLQPLGMGGQHKRLQDLFVDRHVPAPERDGWPLVLAGQKIVWVPGLAVTEPARVRAQTRRLLILTVTPPPRLE